MKTIITVPDKRSGKILFWEDTKASLQRLGLGIGIASAASYFMGILMGMFPGFRALLAPLVTGLSNINPLAVLVIVLVASGAGRKFQGVPGGFRHRHPDDADHCRHGRTHAQRTDRQSAYLGSDSIPALLQNHSPTDVATVD